MDHDLSKVKAYGDTLNDGAVQLSFTPVSYTHLSRRRCCGHCRSLF